MYFYKLFLSLLKVTSGELTVAYLNHMTYIVAIHVMAHEP